MILRKALFLGSFFLSIPLCAVAPIWYSQPAQEWEEALPIGNGRLAAMVFGKITEDRIQFNEESLWSGAPQDADNPNALEALPCIRQLLFEGNYQEAQKLTYANLLCKGEGELRGKAANGVFGCYQTFGDLFLTFPNESNVQNYRRELDLDTATVRVTYSIDDAHYTREYFVSAPDQVCVVRLSCDKPGRISVSAKLSREEKATVRPRGTDTLVMQGQLGVKFMAKLRGIHQNGTRTIAEDALVIDQADSAVFLLAAGTDFRGNPYEEIVEGQMNAAAKKEVALLLESHVADYQSYFQRAELVLEGPCYDAIPTDERLQAVKGGTIDPQLLAQYFQFGRYLLISSSRPGCLPANLQGKWAHLIQTPWNCDYHTNINLQMNYWAAEVANLADCHKPLFDFIAGLQAPGGRTAQIHYNARGWVVHHVTNLWGFTSPAEDARWGLFPAGGGWLCQHLWEHYAFGRDSAFLTNAYPIMRGSAQFYLDLLVEEPIEHRLVTCPSSSPENLFYAPDGQKYGICTGPSMDLEIIWDLFTHTTQAAKILNTDLEFVAQLENALSRLAPLQIGKQGQLQEWLEDFEEPDPGHRHISHLFALYPGHQISLTQTPELAQAARRTLEKRLHHGGGQTGWSRAWIVNFCARLKEAETAHEHLNALLSQSTLPNLFDSHPPFRPHVRPLFQIDGNFGATAGIAEMLLQSHEGEIHLLPALPSAWQTGHYRGLRARGNVEVDVSWENGKISVVHLRPSQTGPQILRFPAENYLVSIEPAAEVQPLSKGVVQLSLQEGEEYTILFVGKNPLIQPLKIATETVQTLLDLEPSVQGFVPVPFRESIEANAAPTEAPFFEDAGVLMAEASFESFCAKPKVANAPFSIPPIVHFIWLGSPPPPTVHLAMESWKKYHPSWKIKLWTDAEAAEFSWSSPRSEYFFQQAQSWSEKSDILRFEILYQFGGIYSDADAVCLKSFDELVRSDLTFFACFEENQIRALGRPLIGSAVIGAEKHHPILQRCLEYSQTKEEAADLPMYLRSGPGPVTKACYEALATGQENILILPCSYLYPLSWPKRLAPLEEIVENIRPESFSIHLWEGTWF